MEWILQENEPANLVGVPLGVPDGTEVIDWTAAVDQVRRFSDEQALEKRGSLMRRSRVGCCHVVALLPCLTLPIAMGRTSSSKPVFSSCGTCGSLNHVEAYTCPGFNA